MVYALFLHSLVRWIIMLLALAVLVQGISGMSSKKPFTSGARKSMLFLMISCDIQLLLGLVLFFVNGWGNVLAQGHAMDNKYNRFYTVEHSIGMLLAIVFIHIGYTATKKRIDDNVKYKRIFWFTLLALVIILATVPWPGKEIVGRPMLRSL
ncbi:MAG: hypothetical protein H0X33_03925 [Taibaiella sp.]|nr:hypothetical protein [Taibaiella sp.]